MVLLDLSGGLVSCEMYKTTYQSIPIVTKIKVVKSFINTWKLCTLHSNLPDLCVL